MGTGRSQSSRLHDLSSKPQRMEEALRCALRSVLGSTGPGVNPKTEFYNKFQREMEEHDRDFEKRYDEDLNTTLIFVSVCGILGKHSGSGAYHEVFPSLVYSRLLRLRSSLTCNRSSSRITRR